MSFWFRKTQAAAKSSSPKRRSISSGLRGFSLVEIAFALGIFSFAIVTIFGLLGLAMSTTKDSQRDSTFASIIRTLDVNIRSATDAAAIAALGANPAYYDMVGKPLTSDSGAFCKVTLVKCADAAVKTTFGINDATKLNVWSATISYPRPSYPDQTVFLLGSSTY